jgi:hypothetical protein
MRPAMRARTSGGSAGLSERTFGVSCKPMWSPNCGTRESTAEQGSSVRALALAVRGAVGRFLISDHAPPTSKL